MYYDNLIMATNLHMDQVLSSQLLKHTDVLILTKFINHSKICFDET